MAKIKIQGNASGTGTLTLTAPNTNSDRTITLPDEDLTLSAGIANTVSTLDPTITSCQAVTPNLTAGHLWVNKTSGETYVCTTATLNNNVWKNIGDGSGNIEPVTYTSATGGTITTNGDYKVHKFEATSLVSAGNGFRVSTLGTADSTVEYLVIAGGGGGKYDLSGGGGAGGYRTATSFTISATNYDITIGGGGATQVSGSPSIFSTITSTGGGYGVSGNALFSGNAGGSGGGGSYDVVAGSGNTPSTSPSQGNNGGAGIYGSGGAASGSGYNPGGGGGAGSVGSNATTSVPGSGGSGASSDILVTGTNITRAGGGGGGLDAYRVPAGSGGSGGSGGGGNGGAVSNAGQTAGDPYTGSGGGGSTQGYDGASGGSGIIILRYKFQ